MGPQPPNINGPPSGMATPSAAPSTHPTSGPPPPAATPSSGLPPSAGHNVMNGGTHSQNQLPHVITSSLNHPPTSAMPSIASSQAPFNIPPSSIMAPTPIMPPSSNMAPTPNMPPSSNMAPTSNMPPAPGMFNSSSMAPGANMSPSELTKPVSTFSRRYPSAQPGMPSHGTPQQQFGMPPQPGLPPPTGMPPQPPVSSLPPQPPMSGMPPQPPISGMPPQPPISGAPPQPSYGGGMPPPTNGMPTTQSRFGSDPHSLSSQLGGLSVTQTGFQKMWGQESLDLLQNRHILPPGEVTAPTPRLQAEQWNNINCSPDLFRCTLSKIPETDALLKKARLPLGVLIHPFKDLSHLPVIQCNTIVRCRSCRTYINPFVHFVDQRRWRCNVCYRVNELPEEFLYDPVSKSFGDPSRRPECKSATIEFIAPSEYMLRPPQPAVYVFLLDVSRQAVETGYVKVFCDSLL